MTTKRLPARGTAEGLFLRMRADVAGQMLLLGERLCAPGADALPFDPTPCLGHDWSEFSLCEHRQYGGLLGSRWAGQCR